MLKNFLQKLVKAIESYQMKRAEYLLQRETYKELSSLTDQELNDIGINRGMIHEVAFKR